MKTLGRARLQGVIEAGAELAAAPDLATLRASAPAAMRRVVDCDLASYNEIVPGALPLVFGDPPDAVPGPLLPRFAELLHQNPLVSHFAATGDGSALRMSDLVPMRALRRTELHAEIYRSIGIDYQTAITVAGGAGAIVGLAFSRAAGDFDEADLMALELIRPQLASTHARLDELEWLRRSLAELEADAAGRAVVLVGAEARVLRATGGATELLGVAVGERLPAALAEAIEREPDRLLVAIDDAFVHLRISPGPAGEPTLAVLERPPAESVRLAALGHGLTAREAELLARLGAGDSTVAAAEGLAISRRTVEKHLEHAYRKLGVSGRRAALATLLRGAAR